jgi:ribosome-binding factor A
MSSGHDRPARVGSEYAHALGQLLARGLKDPRITALVTVTGAKMAPDLRDVTAYVSVMGDEAQKKSTLEGLKAATPYLQSQVARNLKLRWVPHLNIVFDESVERGDRIDRLLREAKARDAMTLAEREAAEQGAAQGKKD